MLDGVAQEHLDIQEKFSKCKVNFNYFRDWNEDKHIFKCIACKILTLETTHTLTCAARINWVFLGGGGGEQFKPQNKTCVLPSDWRLTQDCTVSFFIICNIYSYDSIRILGFFNATPKRIKCKNQINWKTGLQFSVMSQFSFCVHKTDFCP